MKIRSKTQVKTEWPLCDICSCTVKSHNGVLGIPDEDLRQWGESTKAQWLASNALLSWIWCHTTCSSSDGFWIKATELDTRAKAIAQLDLLLDKDTPLISWVDDSNWLRTWLRFYASDIDALICKNG